MKSDLLELAVQVGRLIQQRDTAESRVKELEGQLELRRFTPFQIQPSLVLAGERARIKRELLKLRTHRFHRGSGDYSWDQGVALSAVYDILSWPETPEEAPGRSAAFAVTNPTTKGGSA